MPDLYEVVSDADREWAVVAEDAQRILHVAVDAERPVDLDVDDYRDGVA